MLKLKWSAAADNKSAAAGTTYSLEAENAKKNWYSVYSGTGLAYKHNKLAENQVCNVYLFRYYIIYFKAILKG